MSREEFDKKLEEKIVYIEEILAGFLPEKQGFQKEIYEAMEYSLMAGGKRLRPLFMLETYKLFGGEDSQGIEPFMAAMEMVHTYSLVHDDLPAMDNDDYRRGRKTTHIVYGEAMGILAGDALLNYAFETACRAFDSELPPERVGQALRVLSEKAGVFGMIGGQVIDISATGKQIEKERLEVIYRLKTAALIEASMMIGAILAGAGQDEVKTIELVANGVGMAFQIQDDVLDVTSTTKVLGKPVHSDEKNEKTTYVSLLGLEEAQTAVKEYSEQALNNLEVLPTTNPFLNQLISMLITRKK